MIDAYERVHEAAKRFDVGWRVAAYVVALTRLEKVYAGRCIFPSYRMAEVRHHFTLARDRQIPAGWSRKASLGTQTGIWVTASTRDPL